MAARLSGTRTPFTPILDHSILDHPTSKALLVC